MNILSKSKYLSPISEYFLSGRVITICPFFLKHFLKELKAEFKCEAAVSGEAIAKVYNENKPNLTLLCGGARVKGKFKDNELLIGIPKKVYDDIKDKKVPIYKGWEYGRKERYG